MKKICLLFTAVLFLGISSALNAQNLTVSGFVTDASSGEGVPYASVQLKGSTKVYTLTPTEHIPFQCRGAHPSQYHV